MKDEVAEQQVRYEGIVKAMEEMSPQREIWYGEFLQRIQERGYNTDGDQRMPIKLADIPLRPDRPHKRKERNNGYRQVAR